MIDGRSAPQRRVDSQTSLHAFLGSNRPAPPLQAAQPPPKRARRVATGVSGRSLHDFFTTSKAGDPSACGTSPFASQSPQQPQAVFAQPSGTIGPGSVVKALQTFGSAGPFSVQVGAGWEGRVQSTNGDGDALVAFKSPCVTLLISKADFCKFAVSGPDRQRAETSTSRKVAALLEAASAPMQSDDSVSQMQTANVAMQPRRACPWPGVLYRRLERKRDADDVATPHASPSSWLDNLNLAQREAATAPDRAIIILAGVGSGKTTTILARVAELVSRGVPPRRILLTSFTNKACDEMRERLSSKSPGCRRVNLLTVHSLALAIVQSFHVEAGFARPVTVIDKAPRRLLEEWWRWARLEGPRLNVCQWLAQSPHSTWEDLRAVAEAADSSLHDLLMDFPAPVLGKRPPTVKALAAEDKKGMAQHKWRYAAARALFFYMRRQHDPEAHASLAQDEQLSLPDIPFRPAAGVLPGIRKGIQAAKRDREPPQSFLLGTDFRYAYEAYISWARQECVVDFDDIIECAIKVAKIDHVQLLLRDTFDHVLTDETQDKNERQVELLELLDPPAVTLVGDPDQVIFSFAGSMPNVFQRLRSMWSKARVIPLQENYRSTAAILRAACRALQPKETPAKAMVAAAEWRDKEGPVELWECAEPDDEAKAIASEVRSLIDGGVAPREICILLRNFSTDRGKAYGALVKALVHHEVPHFLIRDSPVLAGAVAQDLMAYCRLLVNPHDDEAFERAFNEPPRRLGPTFLERLREVARLHSCSLLQALPHAQGSSDVLRKSCEFLAIVERARTKVRSLTPGEILRKIVMETQYTETSSRRKAKASGPVAKKKSSAESDESDDSDDDEASQSFQRRVELVCLEADTWLARKMRERKEHRHRESSKLRGGGSETCVPSLWSICSSAWLALPAESNAARRELTAEEEAVLQIAEADVGRGLSVLSDFLDAARLKSVDADSHEGASDGKVQISTIHRSKGGEWDVVFSARFNEGFHPVAASSASMNHETGRFERRPCSEEEAAAHLQEERRLAHVAFSRARRRLVITYVRGEVGADGAWRDSMPSSIALPSDVRCAPPRSATEAENLARGRARLRREEQARVVGGA